MSLDDLFISRIESLKRDLELLTNRPSNSYIQISQSVAKGLLKDLENLQTENIVMKEKLERINEILK
ncbi:hypothetical protein [Brevibacillus formosus]|uniref:hypothetical protein n=1 Tax=Brevibacillus formosus TaxID=54913 RepID=UPI003F1DBBFE